MSNIYYIYCDGSDFKRTNHRLGIGGILVMKDETENGKKIDEYNLQVSLEYMKMFFGTTDCSNPTMEMLAVLESLKKFSKHLSPNDSIIVKADYLGVREWCTGKWKINKSYIQKIHFQIKDYIRKNSLNVQFQWVPGHQKVTDMDSYWNNEVDKLAKGI